MLQTGTSFETYLNEIFDKRSPWYADKVEMMMILYYTGIAVIMIRHDGRKTGILYVTGRFHAISRRSLTWVKSWGSVHWSGHLQRDHGSGQQCASCQAVFVSQLVLFTLPYFVFILFLTEHSKMSNRFGGPFATCLFFDSAIAYGPRPNKNKGPALAASYVLLCLQKENKRERLRKSRGWTHSVCTVFM